MTQQRLNREAHSSREYAELTTKWMKQGLRDGINFSDCIEFGAHQWLEVRQNACALREFRVRDEEQQFYRHRVLPRLQITLDVASFGLASPLQFLTGDTRLSDSDNATPRLLPGLQPGQRPAPFYKSGVSRLEVTGNNLRLQFYPATDTAGPDHHKIEPCKYKPMTTDSTLHADLKATVQETSNITPQQDQLPSNEAGGPSADEVSTVPVPRVPDSQLTISGAPTITPEKIDEVLREYHSPAAGMGQYIYDQGVKHGINPAMALAFYVVESKCGTIGLAVKNMSWGNVRGHGPHGYRPFNSIQESLDDWYRLMGDVYLEKFHADKLRSVVAHYSPNSDGNNESAYVRRVGQLVRKWNPVT
jgi:hypothetical protein